MIHSLVKRLYEEKLYHVLPIHSSYNTYEEVEKDEYFLSFRSIILNVAVSRDLNVVVEETLNTIDNVLNGKPDIVSDNVTEDMMQSILVSIRLLSGTMEYYWNKIDKFCEQDKYDEKYKVSQDSKIGSTRVLKPIKVKEYPNLMTDSLAFRLLDTCTKIKFNGRTLQILANISNYLGHGSNSIIFSTILPRYQKALKNKNIFQISQIMDSTVSHILRFVAASNPNQFFEYIHLHIHKQLIHHNVQNEFQIVQHFELLCQVFLVKSISLQYWELSRYLLRNLTKPLWQHLLLFYVAKAYIFWIMARPEEYVVLIKEYKKYVKDPENKNSPITEFIGSYFDEIYSKFNITSILTNTQNVVPSCNNKVCPEVAPSVSSPHALQHSSSRSFDSPAFHSSLSASSFTNSLGQNQNSVNSSSNLSNISTSSSSTNNTNTSENMRLSSLPELDQFVHSTNIRDESAVINSDIYSMYLRCQSNKRDVSGNKTDENNDKDDLLDELDLQIKVDDMHLNIKKKSSPQDIAHLDGVLALFSHFEDNEPLTHTSPLRFLMILTLFDPDVHEALNHQSYKNLLDKSMIDNSKINYFDSEVSNVDTTLQHQLSGESEKEKDKDREKEKETEKQKNGIRHGFKKLSLLSSSKKKSSKFLSLLLKNLNGSSVTSETAVFDSVRVLLIGFSLTSSISMIDKSLEVVSFAKRVIPTFGVNLDVGENWGKNLTPNKMLTTCLMKNEWNHNQFKIKYFTAVLRFEPIFFIKKLNLPKLGSSNDLQKLNVYIESFKIFFRLPATFEIIETISKQTSAFFKDLLCSISDIVLEDYPTLDEKTTYYVDSILDGTIIEQFGNMKTFSSGTPSIASSMRADSPFTDLNSPISPMKQQPNGDDNMDWAIQSNFSPSPPSNVPLLSALPMARSKSSNLYPKNGNTNGSDNYPVIAPRASANPTTKNRISLLSYPEYDDSTSPSISSQLMSVTSSTPLSMRGSKIQSRTPLKDRTDSDDISRTSQLKLPIHPDSKFSLANGEDTIYAKKILINIFTIFDKFLPLFILPHTDNADAIWVLNDFKNIMKPIFISIILFDELLQRTAEGFMDSLVRHIEEFMNDTSSITIKGYILISSYTVCLFSMGLFDLDINDAKRNILIRTVAKYLKLRGYLLAAARGTDSFDSAVEIDKTTFPLLVGTLGRGLLISLSSSDSEVHKGLRTLYQELEVAIKFYSDYIGDINPDWMTNLPFQKMMAQDDALASNTGSVAFQRKIRKGLLKYTKNLDSILLDGIYVLFRRWKFYAKIGRKLSEDEWAEFRNLAGILAPLSGVLFLGYRELDSLDNPHYEEWVWHLRKDFDFFIYKHCQWLNNSDLIVRENARDVLSIELHPLSYKVLFEHISSRIDELSSTEVALPRNELTYVLLEQIIITLRTILKKDDEEEVMILFSVDILEIIAKLLSLVDMIPHDTSKYYKAVIQLSKMFRALEHSEKGMAIKNHFLLKNKWLKYVTEWFRLAISKEYDIENISKPHRQMDLFRRDLDYLHIDTAIESSKAIAYLTKDLPLETAASSTEGEMKRSKFVTFGNYFNILLKGLEKTMDHEKYPVSLRHKMNIMSENVILALTNLSGANIESSWKFTLPMGYSNNKNIRVAFLKLFINIVSSMQIQKTKIENEKLEAMDNLLQFAIENPQLTYVVANTCPAKDLDAYATVVVNGLETRNAAHIIVSQLVTDEIRHASRPMDILRRNSCATRALSLLSKYKGSEYLIHTLRPILKEYLENKDFFEVEKLKPTDPNYEQHIQLFVKYMRKIIDAVTQSITDFPPEFFYICQNIYTEVQKKFPDYVYIATGSFVFLRLICPALVNPEAENIIEIGSARENRPLISLAKAIQNLANGSENMIKWPSLSSQSEFLSECSTKIFTFLKKVCDPERKAWITIRKDGPSKPFEYSFLHYLLVTQEIEIRKRLLEGLKSTDDFSFFKKTFLLLDDVFGKLGEPKLELSHEIPEFFRVNSEKYPRLYDYMNRQTFRKHRNMDKAISAVYESITSSGTPIISLIIGRETTFGVDLDSLIYQLLKVYVRIWGSTHYFVLDLTEFDGTTFDVRKMITALNTLLPSIAIDNCRGYYLLNVNENFMGSWDAFFEHENIYIEKDIPIHFINSSSDGALIKALHLGGEGVGVLQDIRVSLHDLKMANPTTNSKIPVSLKIGNKYFQILDETDRPVTIKQSNEVVSLKINEVRELVNISSVYVSATSGTSSEFTIKMYDDETFVFCGSKFLEIVKMFHYAIAREETSLLTDPSTIMQSQNGDDNDKGNEYNDLICNLILVMVVGLFHPDNIVKSLSYNLFGEAEKTFHLRFGTGFHKTPELYIPANVTSFLYMLAKVQSRNNPTLTASMWKYSLKALHDNFIPKDYIPTVLYTLSNWVPNLVDYVYLTDKEDGGETIAKIFRNLIRLTVEDTAFTTVYLQEIWFPIGADGRLSEILVNEAINHALERDSENRPWENIISIICSFPTVEIAREIMKRLLNAVDSFLPSLQMEASTQSWAELKILVSIAAYTFFETPFITKMFLPDILFTISLLIDVGPTDLRLLVHELLMNLCSSLAIDDSLNDNQKEKLEKHSLKFSKHRVKYISGFSQHKGKLLLTLNASSFASKFSILQDFVDEVLDVMKIFSAEDSLEWIVRYKKSLTDTVFSSSSFLSSRATMILGIIGKEQPSEALCRDLLLETIKIASQPIANDENMFSMVSHCFTYGAIVEGLQPSSYLIKQLFWLSIGLVDTYNGAIFEGGLLLISKTLSKISEDSLSNSRQHVNSVDTLLDSRKFALDIYEQIDETHNIVWSQENFPHILGGIMSSGYSIVSIRHISIHCLKSVFINSFLEEKMYGVPTNYHCYMFLLFSMVNNEEFLETLKEVDYKDELLPLSRECQIPSTLLQWLASDSDASNISLYQVSLIFNNKFTDEQTRLRFALIMRYLLIANPMCLFKFYGSVEEKIKKLIIVDNIGESIPILFDIIGQAVKYEEFDKIKEYQMETLKKMEARGLKIVTALYSLPLVDKDADVGDIDTLVKRRKLLVLALERVVCL
ncbi:inhibitory regulator protein Ira2p [Monosporozyma unispora]